VCLSSPSLCIPHPILSAFPLSQIQTFFSEPCSQYPEFPLRLDTNIIFEYSHLFLKFNIEKANSIVHSFLLIYSTVCYKLHFYKHKNILILRGSNPSGARFSAPVLTGPEAHPASCTMGTGSFPGLSTRQTSVNHYDFQPSTALYSLMMDRIRSEICRSDL